MAAPAFTVFNLGTLAQSFDASRAAEPVAAVYCTVKAEWHFVHFEPPALPKIVRVEQQIRAAHREGNDQPASRDAVSEELQNILTGSYYAGYEAYIIGNAESAVYRMWALRLVLLALGCVAVAFLLLPFHGGRGDVEPMTSRSARKRLIAANRNLSLKEEQIRAILKLRVQPRLSLFDESSVTYVTAEDRGDLNREDQDPEDRPNS